MLPSLSLSALVYSSFALFCLWTAATWIYNLFLHPLAAIPGPRIAAASQIWTRVYEWRMRRAHAMLDLHRRYNSPVVRVSPNELSFSDPLVLPEIYRDQKIFIKSDFYARRKAYQEDHLFSTRDPARHAGRRKLAAKAFSAQSLQQFEPVMLDKVSLLLERWADYARDGRPLEAFEWLHMLSFETMLALAFNIDGEGIKTGQPHIVLKYLVSWRKAFLYRETYGHWLNTYGHWLPGAVGSRFRDMRAWKQYSIEVVRKAREEQTDTVYLSNMLNEPDSWSGQTLSDGLLAEEAMGLMFGGTGTTANALVTLIYAVLRDQTVQKRLEEEVRSHTPITERVVLPYAITGHFEYLNAVLKENLRRYPSIIGSQPRVAVQDTHVGGVFVQKGTVVVTTNWTMHHCERYFPDPDQFDPDRFLTKSKTGYDPNEAWQPFGVGARACIGRNLSLQEMSIMAAAFFRRFDATLDASMTEDLFVQNDTFNASPQGHRLVLHLKDRLGSWQAH